MWAQRSFLDPKAAFMQFNLKYKTAAGSVAMTIDDSAHSVINLLEVYYGST